MGNTPTKEARPRASTYSGSHGGPYGGGSSTGSSGLNSILGDGPLGGVGGSGGRSSRRNTVFGNMNDYKKSKRQEERDKQREDHYMRLVVKFDETVDGGYLAPFGTYKSNLDYNVDIVRELIINRKLAPFYTPLQDYDDSWKDEELLIILSQLPLHSIEGAYSEEEEDDIDNHKIHKSANYYKRQEHKRKMRLVIEQMKEAQKHEENRFLSAKQFSTKQPASGASRALPSKDLLLLLYKNLVECPICFLYYPDNLNLSRCCLQPICTECFVQIKRLDPHTPHDDPANDNPNSEELPHTLISEPANCPYCAMTDFGVIFEKNLAVNTGINGLPPGEYKASNDGNIADINVEHVHEADDKALDDSAIQSTSPSSDISIKPKMVEKRKRRSSMPANSPKVVTIDQIRPDWEVKLASARNKLARKAAAALAIHASNLIINPDTDVPEYDTRRRRNASRIQESSSNNNSGDATPSNSRLQTVEDRMIEEALRLSILDEEERRRKAELSTPE